MNRGGEHAPVIEEEVELVAVLSVARVISCPSICSTVSRIEMGVLRCV
jgi:hypothetical protein